MIFLTYLIIYLFCGTVCCFYLTTRKKNGYTIKSKIAEFVEDNDIAAWVVVMVVIMLMVIFWPYFVFMKIRKCFL